MDIFIGILMVVEVLVCLLLILIVLMQRPRQEGLGASFGGDMMSQIAGAQTTNVLQKFTVYLAIILFVLTLTISMLTARQQTAKANTQIFAPDTSEAAKTEEPAPTAATPEADKKEDEKPAPAKDEAAPAKKEASESTPAPAAPKSEEAPKEAAPKSGEPAKPAAPAMKEPGEPAAPPPAAEKSTPAPAAPKSDS